MERAQAVRANFQLTVENAPIVAAICERLDGLPLAIELAAARFKVLPPAALLQRLESRLPVLSGGARDLPARQRTMSDTIVWSYDLLSPDEQALFRALSVFAGGFCLDAVEGVSAAPQGALLRSEGFAALRGRQPSASALDLVAVLLDKSLLKDDGGTEPDPRFGMLETIREFGLAHLASNGEEADVRNRHAAWCQQLATSAEIALEQNQDVLAWTSRLDAERANLHGALDWLLHSAEPQLALQLLGGLYDYWTVRPFSSQTRQLLDAALAAALDASPLVRAPALNLAVCMASGLGDPPAARRHAVEGSAVALTTSDRHIIGRAHYHLGMAWEYSGDAEQATIAYADAVAMFDEDGDPAWFASALSGLGEAYVASGRGDAALPLLERALTLHQQTGYTWGVAETIGHLADAALARQDIPRAVSRYAESIDAARAAGDNKLVAIGLAGLAGAALAVQKLEGAVRWLATAAAAGVGRPYHLDHAQRIETQGGTALGDEAFAAAWAAGQSLSMDAAVAEALAGDLLLVEPNQSSSSSATADPYGLTPREREVLHLIAQGLTDPAIAEALYLRPQTAKTHAKRILDKLGVNTRAGAAAKAVAESLI